MKIVEEYMQMPHKLELAPDGEVGFVASFAELPGCLTCGATVEAARTNAIDAKREWLEAAIDQGIHIQQSKT